MTARHDNAPDVDRLARSMVLLHGGHDDDDHDEGSSTAGVGSWSKAPDLGPEHTAVQWNSEATARCAYFAEVRACGGDSSRSKSCPKLGDSIKHAVAEGCLEKVSTAPSPGDG
jgi:hypothetical protein